jgi:hypothetical protein
MGSIENYTKLCTIEIDLSHLPLSFRPKYFGRGSFYRLEYDIILLFGLTELKAMVAWKQDVGLLLFFVAFFIYIWCVARVWSDGAQRKSYIIKMLQTMTLISV